MTTVKDYIDCPRCGAKKIRADIPMCSECEIAERLAWAIWEVTHA